MMPISLVFLKNIHTTLHFLWRKPYCYCLFFLRNAHHFPTLTLHEWLSHIINKKVCMYSMHAHFLVCTSWVCPFHQKRAVPHHTSIYYLSYHDDAHHFTLEYKWEAVFIKVVSQQSCYHIFARDPLGCHSDSYCDRSHFCEHRIIKIWGTWFYSRQCVRSLFGQSIYPSKVRILSFSLSLSVGRSVGSEAIKAMSVFT